MTHPQSPASPLPEAADPVAYSLAWPRDVRNGTVNAETTFSTRKAAETYASDCMQPDGCDMNPPPVVVVPLYAAPSPVAQAPAQAGEVAEEAKRLMVNYCHAILNCGERATDQNVKAVVSAENAVYAVIDRLAALATPPAQPVLAPVVREPLTEEQVTALLVELNSRCVESESPSAMFLIIVRAIEAAHGIQATTGEAS